MPSVKQLCKRLHINRSGADPITQTDVASVRAYRQALHTRMIERNPGQYSRRLLSERLAVSQDTLRRYERDANVRVTPMYTRLPLYQHNLNRYVPRSFEHASPGVFLEDDRGNRYPLKHPLACKLLAEKRQLYRVQQEPNHYRIGSDKPQLPPDYVLQPQRGPDEGAIAAYWQQLSPTSPRPRRNVTVGVRTLPQHDPVWLKQHGDACARRYDPDGQRAYWAERIYEQVNQDVTTDQRISRQTAQALIGTYGVKAVKRGLGILGARRAEIHNPAGWLVVFLRSDNKRRVQSGQTAMMR